MKLPDVNVLLYAMNVDAPEHRRAREWLERALSGSEAVAFAWVVLSGFVRISTRAPKPRSVAQAFDVVEEWLDRPNVEVVHPTRRHAPLLRGLIEQAGTAGNLTTDAHLAALAIEHGATLASFDGDLHRFAGLRLEYLR
ncbi:MAG: type II toxin-antitoxin system VapC family toxin [Actinomycetota bacterium]|nr:type II toxin-antitoxin system VapC family toxin [Actinomycetota bacterium]